MRERVFVKGERKEVEKAEGGGIKEREGFYEIFRIKARVGKWSEKFHIRIGHKVLSDPKSIH